jgi:hypothetical protein
LHQASLSRLDPAAPNPQIHALKESVGQWLGLGGIVPVQHVNGESQSRLRQERTVGKRRPAERGVDKRCDPQRSVVDAQYPFDINAQPPMPARGAGPDYSAFSSSIGEIVD